MWPDLTPEEIRALPLDLRCCFYIMPWNKGFSPKTIREWAIEHGGPLLFPEEDNLVLAADFAEKEARRLFEFVTMILKEQGVA